MRRIDRMAQERVARFGLHRTRMRLAEYVGEIVALTSQAGLILVRSRSIQAERDALLRAYKAACAKPRARDGRKRRSR